MLKTFPGGTHPPSFKELTSDKPIISAPLPDKVILPLIQHTGTPAEAKVSVGDYVRRGQLIGDAQAFITSPVHSSISGTVKEISKSYHPAFGECVAVVIEGDGKDSADDSIISRRNADSLKRQGIIDIIKRCGIVGLGGAVFPTHVKLTPPERKKIDTILLNGAECEPYLSCDYRLILEKSNEIIRGLKLIMKALDVKTAYIAVEDNKPDAICAVRTAITEYKARPTEYDTRQTKYDIQVVTLETKYPQGGEKQLIKAVLGREVPPEKLPFEVGCLVSNVGTAYAICKAIYESKPLYERVVTVTGDAVKEPKNLLVRIGTPVSKLVDACGGFSKKPGKIIFGGPMMGISQYTLDVPVIKGTSGILLMSEEEAKAYSELTCIKCARCVDVCPMNLIPTKMYQLVKTERYEAAKAFNPVDCMECGACAYECPSRIPLVHYVKLAKLALRRSDGK